MRHLPSVEDQMRNVTTYEMADGKRVTLANEAIRQYGLERLLYDMRLGPNPADMPRRPVYWSGEMIGTLPGTFNPANVRSRSGLYDARPGDFVADGNGWRASEALGPGDIACVEGFKPA